MDIAEKMAADIALAIDGGDWQDAKWFSKFHREAWIKAVQPYADEIERLQLREETLSGIIDGMTARFIEAQGAVEEIERLRKENQRQKEHIMLLNSLVQTEHNIIRVVDLKEGE